MPAKLRDVAGNDVVVGVGNDAQLEAHGLELRQCRNDFAERRHPRDGRGQSLTVLWVARQPKLFQGQLQALGTQFAERTIRRDLLQSMLVAVIDLDQAVDIHGMLAFVAQNIGHHGFQAFIPLNQRAVAIESQPFGAWSVLQCHGSIL
ncbi:hypothetical protein D3C84_652050 [compost metagenome]